MAFIFENYWSTYCLRTADFVEEYYVTAVGSISPCKCHYKSNVYACKRFDSIPSHVYQCIITLCCSLGV